MYYSSMSPMFYNMQFYHPLYEPIYEPLYEPIYNYVFDVSPPMYYGNYDNLFQYQPFYLSN
jgi:hypothetical protein